MDTYSAALLIAVLICFIIYATVMIDRNKEHQAALAELERWRVGWSEADRWLAEFPDVAAAFAHLKAKADGTGGTDIVRTREAMRRRRDQPHKRPGLTAQAAAAREEEFRVQYQHMGAECDGGDDPAPRVQHHSV